MPCRVRSKKMIPKDFFFFFFCVATTSVAGREQRLSLPPLDDAQPPHFSRKQVALQYRHGERSTWNVDAGHAINLLFVLFFSVNQPPRSESPS